MRELKFRIWVKDEERYYDESDDESYQIIPNGQVVYTSEAYEEDGVFYTDTTNATDNVVVEQYTGIKDKNGKEIYEGDIVRVGGKWKLAVAYTRAFCAFELQNTDREECMDLRHEHMGRYEVIGNIHENPELLEGKE